MTWLSIFKRFVDAIRNASAARAAADQPIEAELVQRSDEDVAAIRGEVAAAQPTAASSATTLPPKPVLN